jgi:hypothetical protein
LKLLRHSFSNKNQILKIWPDIQRWLNSMIFYWYCYGKVFIDKLFLLLPSTNFLLISNSMLRWQKLVCLWCSAKQKQLFNTSQCAYSFYIRVTSLPPFLMLKKEGLKRRKLSKAIHKRKTLKAFWSARLSIEWFFSSPNPRHSRHVTQKSWNSFFDLLANSKLLNKFADILLSLLLVKFIQR